MPTSERQSGSQVLLLRSNPECSGDIESSETEENLKSVSEAGKPLKAQDRLTSIPENEPSLGAEGNVSEDNGRQKKFLLAGSLLLNIFLFALIVSTAYFMASENRDIQRKSGLCLNCTILKLYPDDDLSMYSVYEGNICCVKDGGNYSSMVERLIERELKEKLISESPVYQPLQCEQDRSTPVIKLMGKLTDIADTKNTHYPWLRWDLDVHSGAGSVGGQLTYDDKFITVGSTGIYMVYSQLVIHNKKPEGPTAFFSGTDKYYLHGIYRASESGQDERLLGGHYTYFQNQGQTEITSYVGSPYQLSKGDRLGVKVHDFNQIVPSNLTNFFGMHLIE